MKSSRKVLKVLLNAVVQASYTARLFAVINKIFDSYLPTFLQFNLKCVFFYRACKHEVEKKRSDQAKRISASFLSENPYSISMWKVYHSLTLRRILHTYVIIHCHKELFT